jgi:hypothetical protein
LAAISVGPGNRFWPALYAGGFTPHLFSPFESSLLLDLNLGINPSDLNAHCQPAALAQLFGDLRVWAVAQHRRRRKRPNSKT